ncbi:MAG: CshA/CshB family fibrillar adhesin-related protein [Pseudomonadota bacterium]
MRYAVLLLAFVVWLGGAPVSAQSSCSAAGAQGTAPASWQTYCWLDFASYNDAQARSAAGQDFAFSLTDGSTLNLNVRATSTAATAADDRTAPSWSGAAVGNTAFLGIPGRPILYMLNSGSTVTMTFRNISVTPPPGVAAVTSYAFVVADAESTDNQEYLEFTTDGADWVILDQVPPISGNQYPAISGAGTDTVRMDGAGQTGRVGAWIAGSGTPTEVVAEMRGAGLQGFMFAVRFASITLTKEIGGARVDDSDQFRFRIQSTSSGDVLAEGTTSGTGLGPFDAAVLSTASGIPVTLTEDIAAGSASTMARYQPILTCVNNAGGSSTPLPSNVETTSYDFGSLTFGDAVECTFTNTPRPHVRLQKALGSGGRIFDTDQFRLQVRQGGANLAQVTTTGSGSAIDSPGTGPVEVVPATNLRVRERAAGTTDLARYTQGLSCTNRNTASSTALPTSVNTNFQLAFGDVIDCTILNTRDPATVDLLIRKEVEALSDPVNGSNDPKFIPGARIRYRLIVTNRGDGPVDPDSLVMEDTLPADFQYDGAVTVGFVDGSVPSGLDPFDAATMVDFATSTGGPYGYTPASGIDPAVRAIRIAPQGQLAAAIGSDRPSFEIRFEGIVP